MNRQLRAELLARAQVDQKVREQVAARWPGGASIDVDDPLYGQWCDTDSDNTAWLRMTVEMYGWPGVELVGADGAHAAWLLAQHADDDPELQRRFLTLMRTAVAVGEADEADLAYLIDRVAVHNGQPQVYGTQHEWRDGRWTPQLTVEPHRVDERRSAVGLGMLAEVTDKLNARVSAI